MKIAIDARMIEMSGIGTYIQHLIDAGIYEVALGNEKSIKAYNSEIETIPFFEKIYGIKEQIKFPYKLLKKENIDILHVPHYNIPIFYKGNIVVTIHDLTHLILPEFLPNKLAYIYAKILIGYAVKKAKYIFTVSENSKNDITRMFNINPEKIIVTYNAVDSEFCIKEKSEIYYLYDKFNIPKDKKILMYVGNLKPHKNLSRLLKAYAKLKIKEETCLLLVGKSFNSTNLIYEEKDLNIYSSVIHTGIVNKKELIDLYNIADLFIFPSLYEGFGIPPLEAMACGTPVVCSNNSSLPEVVGDAAITFDALNVLEIKNAIENMLLNNEADIYIKKGLERVRKFSWNNTASIVKKKICKIEK